MRLIVCYEKWQRCTIKKTKKGGEGVGKEGGKKKKEGKKLELSKKLSPKKKKKFSDDISRELFQA